MHVDLLELGGFRGWAYLVKSFYLALVTGGCGLSGQLSYVTGLLQLAFWWSSGGLCFITGVVCAEW